MKKKLFLTLELTFSDNVPQADHETIAINVANSIARTVDDAGIVPDDAEYYTTNISVGKMTKIIEVKI